MKRRRLTFAVPGDLETRTGGTLYDKHLIKELRAIGWEVRHLELPGDFPEPSPDSLEATQEALAGIKDGEIVLIDGLAYGVMAAIAEHHASRLRLCALVHHPLAFETGLDPARAAALLAAERAALAHARVVIVTSQPTGASVVAELGVPASKITVAMPGTDTAPLARGSGGEGPVRLLAVGSVIPRKGFPALIESLAGHCGDLAWHLAIAGSLARDPGEGARLRDAIERADLAARVRLEGECSKDRLAQLFDAADLFVSASRYEGFGMALAEAVAHGLACVAVAGGAVGQWMDPRAALLVDPNEPQALGQALRRVITDPATRQSLRAGAHAARANLADWAETARHAERALLAAGDLAPVGEGTK